MKIDESYIKNLQNETAIELINHILNDTNLDKKIYKIQRILYLKNILEKTIIHSNESNIEILIEISKWYFEITKQKSPKWLEDRIYKYYTTNKNKVYIYNLSTFIAEKWKVDDIIKDSVLLSGDQISNYIPTEKDVKFWINLRKKNPELYLGIVFCGQIIGHIGAVAMSTKEYISMKKGFLYENELKFGTKNIEHVEFLYVPTIVILPQYRSPYLLKKILKEFFLSIEKINKDKSLKSILINAYTPQGKLLSKKLGFQFVTLHRDGGEIYNLDMSLLSKKSYLINKF